MDQSTASNSSPKKRNNQALTSLILGILAIVLFPLNFTSGQISLVGAGGVALGILALWLGYRGILIDKQYRRGGKAIAYTGMGLGAAGLLAFGILFAFGAHPELTPADIGIGTPRNEYEGDGFTLKYPENWEEANLTEQPFCEQESVECLVGFTGPTQETSNLTLIRYELTQDASLKEVDDFFWQMYNDNIPDVSLESREEIKVAGTPAVKRVYHSPSPQGDGTREYSIQVGLIKDLSFYQFTAWAPGQEPFNAYRGAFMDIIRSLEFTE